MDEEEDTSAFEDDGQDDRDKAADARHELAVRFCARRGYELKGEDSWGLEFVRTLSKAEAAGGTPGTITGRLPWEYIRKTMDRQ